VREYSFLQKRKRNEIRDQSERDSEEEPRERVDPNWSREEVRVIDFIRDIY
jgi:hypothetical protein